MFAAATILGNIGELYYTLGTFILCLYILQLFCDVHSCMSVFEWHGSEAERHHLLLISYIMACNAKVGFSGYTCLSIVDVTLYLLEWPIS